MRPLELAGQRFGRLLVLSRVENNKEGRTAWLCRCECGVSKIITGTGLMKGTKSCGCYRNEVVRRPRAHKKLEGLRFGRLTVVSRQKNNNLKEITWLCRCDCAVEKTISGRSLTRGLTRSCGCLQKEAVRKTGKARRGDKCHNWKGGITPEQNQIRASEEYKKWRNAVFVRDNFLCQECGAAGEIQAHHIKAFAAFPELRFEISNGQTLCVPCHKKTPSYLTGKEKI